MNEGAKAKLLEALEAVGVAIGAAFEELPNEITYEIKDAMRALEEGHTDLVNACDAEWELIDPDEFEDA